MFPVSKVRSYSMILKEISQNAQKKIMTCEDQNILRQEKKKSIQNNKTKQPKYYNL